MIYSDNSPPKNKVPVTVIIPCYRCSETINRAVDSVLQQSKVPKEIILVDDFSEDGTLEKLSLLQKNNPEVIKVLALHENRGPGVARNKAWDQATQPYIAFLDSDDSWHPEKIDIQYSWMIDNPTVQLTGHLLSEGPEHLAVSLKNNITSRNIDATELLFFNRFPTPTVMLKKDLPYRMGEKKYSEDYLLWLKIALSNQECQLIEVPLARLYKFPYGEGGLSADIWKLEKGELNTYFEIRKLKLISHATFGLTIGFSLLKYLRRVAIINFRNLRNHRLLT
ncbi:hypothetical protein PS862_01354 [Pseudomonas fluorescens]|uniref:Glycosyltransferase 2-like domain-containing protein n=1 Tax=Pseudomonas fluorescens TaxID=294 RepID=A0A5E7I680_PSEFL|nr:glycosyltransferase family 2 protein [Pseudomonas fluorescens]VVO71356.1 hypothetical protein PS862_01354 [Pseudomonas fluorescens]